MRHDIKRDQEVVDPAFARGLRALADRTGAVLILDDVDDVDDIGDVRAENRRQFRHPTRRLTG
jgi:hypothetical protein